MTKLEKKLRTMSASEREVLRLMVKGLDPAAIATKRKKSVATIQTQVKAVNRKMGTGSTTKTVVEVLTARVRQLERFAKNVTDDDLPVDVLRPANFTEVK